MKTLNEYLALPYKMELIPDPDEGGFVVSFPELPGCVTTGETAEQAIANARDAKVAWLTAALEDHIVIPEPIMNPPILDCKPTVVVGFFALALASAVYMRINICTHICGPRFCAFLLARISRFCLESIPSPCPDSLSPSSSMISLA